VAVLGVVTFDKFIKIFAFERVGLEGEVHVGAQIVDPELLGPGCFAGRFAVKEEVMMDQFSLFPRLSKAANLQARKYGAVIM
jgi:hypothetical protein